MLVALGVAVTEAFFFDVFHSGFSGSDESAHFVNAFFYGVFCLAVNSLTPWVTHRSFIPHFLGYRLVIGRHFIICS